MTSVYSLTCLEKDAPRRMHQGGRREEESLNNTIAHEQKNPTRLIPAISPLREDRLPSSNPLLIQISFCPLGTSVGVNRNFLLLFRTQGGFYRHKSFSQQR